MKSSMKFLARKVRRFRSDEDGLVMTEFLIMLPLLVWTFMALFVYWDAFRTINQGQKAAYSVADVISRQREMNMTFVNGMQTVAEYLTQEAPNVRLRITAVVYDEDDDRHLVIFSRSPGGRMPQHTNATIANVKDRIPLMADMDSVVIVETEIEYDPGFDVGIPNHSFDNFIVTRPRYDRCVSLDTVPCPNS